MRRGLTSDGLGVGSIFGTILNGWLITAFGPRRVVLCTLCVMSCFLFIVFFAPSKPVLLVGEILLGFEWGIVGRLSPSVIMMEYRGNAAADLFSLPLVRDHGPGVRVRSPAPPAAGVLHLLHEHVLHHWPIHIRCRAARAGQPHRPVGISHPIRDPMDLAGDLDPNHLFRSGVAMALGPP